MNIHLSLILGLTLVIGRSLAFECPSIVGKPFDPLVNGHKWVEIIRAGDDFYSNDKCVEYEFEQLNGNINSIIYMANDGVDGSPLTTNYNLNVSSGPNNNYVLWSDDESEPSLNFVILDMDPNVHMIIYSCNHYEDVNDIEEHMWLLINEDAPMDNFGKMVAKARQTFDFYNTFYEPGDGEHPIIEASNNHYCAIDYKVYDLVASSMNNVKSTTMSPPTKRSH